MLLLAIGVPIIDDNFWSALCGVVVLLLYNKLDKNIDKMGDLLKEITTSVVEQRLNNASQDRDIELIILDNAAKDKEIELIKNEVAHIKEVVKG
jgi:hypothetical protein